MNSDGSGLRRLTSGARDIYPVWSRTASGSRSCVRSRAEWRLFVVSPTGAGLRRLPQAPPAGRPTWTAKQQVDHDPVGGRPRSGGRPDRQDPAVLRPDAGHPDHADRHRLAGGLLSRVPRAAPEHRPGGLRRGPVPAVRALPGARPGAPPSAAGRQRHRRRGLVTGREDPGLRAPGSLNAQDRRIRRDEDDRHRASRRRRRFATRVAAALSVDAARERISDDSEGSLHRRLGLVGRQGGVVRDRPRKSRKRMSTLCWLGLSDFLNPVWTPVPRRS